MATAAANLRAWWTPRRWTAALSRLLHPDKKHPFDRAHGVDTGGLIYADPDAAGHAGDRHNAGYYATAPSLFHGAIGLWRAALPATCYALEDYTLVDIGCGKGRALMLATGYAFREIVGIELNPRLARTAQKNLRKWRRVFQVSPEPDKTSCLPDPEQSEGEGPAFVLDSPERGCPRSPVLGPGNSLPSIRIIEADALAAPIPDTPVALFYFNSFERPMMEMWLARLAGLARHRTSPLDLIYLHPEFDSLVRQVPGMRFVAEAEIPFSQDDARADAFGVSSDLCAIYRLSTPDM